VLLFAVLLQAVVADDGVKIGSTSTHNDPQLRVQNPSQAIFISSRNNNNPTIILLTAAKQTYIHFTHLSITGVFSCLTESTV
jgi:hypothetical protein